MLFSDVLAESLCFIMMAIFRLLTDIKFTSWQPSILSLEAVHNPRLLIRFVLLTFADLKLYRFTYW
jgi:hypothetical protein